MSFIVYRCELGNGYHVGLVLHGESNKGPASPRTTKTTPQSKPTNQPSHTQTVNEQHYKPVHQTSDAPHTSDSTPPPLIPKSQRTSAVSRKRPTLFQGQHKVPTTIQQPYFPPDLCVHSNGIELHNVDNVRMLRVANGVIHYRITALQHYNITPRTSSMQPSMCHTEKAPNAWHRQGTSKTGNTYNQPKQPSTGTTHRPSTRAIQERGPRIERAVQKSRRTTPPSTAAAHASSTATVHAIHLPARGSSSAAVHGSHCQEMTCTSVEAPNHSNELSSHAPADLLVGRTAQESYRTACMP